MSEDLNITVTDDKKLVKADMRQLAKLCRNDIDITPALSANTVDNMKAFLVAYSRSQLNRVVTLTNSLNKLEDDLINQTLEAGVDPKLLISVIRTIHGSLDSALGLIKQVTSDESYLQVIINNTKIIQNNINQTSINNRIHEANPILASQDSRDKVRGALNTIFAKLNELPVEEGGGSSNDIEAEVISESNTKS